MKKAVSILIAGIILLSGAHLSVSTHFCQGHYIATKISLTGEKATCGMPSDADNNSGQEQFKQNCCNNNIAQLAVDSNYEQSTFGHLPEVKDHELLAVAFALTTFIFSLSLFSSPITLEFPPGGSYTRKVDLSFICTLLI